MRERIDALKQTRDDWYPSHQIAGWYKGKRNVRLVTVSFLEFHDGGFRVCVWGADDYGLERDFLGSERGTAFDLFITILQESSVGQDWLKDLGFILA